jgi:hypothetical protein
VLAAFESRDFVDVELDGVAAGAAEDELAAAAAVVVLRDDPGRRKRRGATSGPATSDPEDSPPAGTAAAPVEDLHAYSNSLSSSDKSPFSLHALFSNARRAQLEIGSAAVGAAAAAAAISGTGASDRSGSSRRALVGRRTEHFADKYNTLADLPASQQVFVHVLPQVPLISHRAYTRLTRAAAEHSASDAVAAAGDADTAADVAPEPFVAPPTFGFAGSVSLSPELPTNEALLVPDPAYLRRVLADREFARTLYIASPTGVVPLTLRGRAVMRAPALSRSALDIGQCFTNTPVVRRVTVRNPNAVNLPFSAATNHVAFSVQPASGVIPALGCVELSLRFLSSISLDTRNRIAVSDQCFLRVTTYGAPLLEDLLLPLDAQCTNYVLDTDLLTPVHFGHLLLNSTSVVTRTLRNSCDTDVHYTLHFVPDEASVAAGAAARVALVDDDGHLGSGAAPQSAVRVRQSDRDAVIPALGHRVVQVAFTPLTRAPLSGHLVLETRAGPYLIPVLGIGVEPTVSVTGPIDPHLSALTHTYTATVQPGGVCVAPAVDVPFGLAGFGQPMQQCFQVQNTCSLPLRLDCQWRRVRVNSWEPSTDPDSGGINMKADADVCLRWSLSREAAWLQPGQSCVLTVVYQPATPPDEIRRLFGLDRDERESTTAAAAAGDIDARDMQRQELAALRMWANSSSSDDDDDDDDDEAGDGREGKDSSSDASAARRPSSKPNRRSQAGGGADADDEPVRRQAPTVTDWLAKSPAELLEEQRQRERQAHEKSLEIAAKRRAKALRGRLGHTSSGAIWKTLFKTANDPTGVAAAAAAAAQAAQVDEHAWQQLMERFGDRGTLEVNHYEWSKALLSLRVSGRGGALRLTIAANSALDALLRPTADAVGADSAALTGGKAVAGKIAPVEVRFGSIPLNTSRSRTITVRNTGHVPLCLAAALSTGASTTVASAGVGAGAVAAAATQPGLGMISSATLLGGLVSTINLQSGFARIAEAHPGADADATGTAGRGKVTAAVGAPAVIFTVEPGQERIFTVSTQLNRKGTFAFRVRFWLLGCAPPVYSAASMAVAAPAGGTSPGTAASTALIPVGGAAPSSGLAAGSHFMRVSGYSRQWDASCVAFGDEIELSAAAAAALLEEQRGGTDAEGNTRGLFSYESLHSELADSAVLRQVVSTDSFGRVGPVDLAHVTALASLEPDRSLDPLSDLLAIPVALGPEIMGGFRRWYHNRLPLRMTKGPE